MSIEFHVFEPEDVFKFKELEVGAVFSTEHPTTYSDVFELLHGIEVKDTETTSKTLTLSCGPRDPWLRVYRLNVRIEVEVTHNVE